MNNYIGQPVLERSRTFDNGVTMSEHYIEDLLDGVLHGPTRLWHANGTLFKDMMYQYGKLVGEYREWHDNGQLAEFTIMGNGDEEDVVTLYTPEGHRMDDAGQILEYADARS